MRIMFQGCKRHWSIWFISNGAAETKIYIGIFVLWRVCEKLKLTIV